MKQEFDTPEDREHLAGEFVLGTLDPGEKLQAEALYESDPGFAALVKSWRTRFASLDEAVEPVPVPPEIWARIESGLAGLKAVQPVREIDARRENMVMSHLYDRIRFWRRSAMFGGLVAAGLAAVIVSSPPLALQRLLGIEAPADQRYVAVVNRDGVLPALIVSVDARAGTVEVRSVDAERPADKSLEVWYLADGQDAPLSLGLVDQVADVTKLKAASGAGLTGKNPLIAVSLEPLGGSPVAGPTGPIVYSGKLLPDN